MDTRTKVIATGIVTILLTGTLLGQEQRQPRGQAQSRHEAPQVQQQAPPPPPPQQRPAPERLMMHERTQMGMMRHERPAQDQNRGEAVPRRQGAMNGRGPGQGAGPMMRPPQGRPEGPGAMRGPMNGRGPGYPLYRGRAIPRGGHPMLPGYEYRNHQSFRWSLGLGGVYMNDFGYYGNYPLYPYRSYYESGSFGHLKVKGCPREAGVLIDEGFAGLVDASDGVFQDIVVEVGSHIVSVVFDEETLAEFRVYVSPYQTQTLRCR